MLKKTVEQVFVEEVCYETRVTEDEEGGNK